MLKLTMLNTTLKKILNKLGITSESKLGRLWRSIQLSEKLTKRLYFADLVNSYYIARYINSWEQPVQDTDLLSILVFSYDRAFQLDALLGSFSDKVVDAKKYKLAIIYRFSTPEHQQAYDEVFALHQDLNIIPIHQDTGTSFKVQTIKIIEGFTSKKLMFLVDDILFTEDVDLKEFASLPNEFYIPSLRLGKNITYSYAASKNIEIPQFIAPTIFSEAKLIPHQTNVWKWSTGERHWRRMLSVDGNIFDRREYLFLMQQVDFTSPNTLEDAVATAFDEFYKHKLGICYDKSKLVNIPINNVNQLQDSSFHNRFGNIHQDTLLKLWQQKQQMAYRNLYGVHNTSVHEEIPFETQPR